MASKNGNSLAETFGDLAGAILRIMSWTLMEIERTELVTILKSVKHCILIRHGTLPIWRSSWNHNIYRKFFDAWLLIYASHGFNLSRQA
jgi:hypothetical protein